MQREKLKYLTKIGHTRAVEMGRLGKGFRAPVFATTTAYSERPILGYI
jgi:hypothetical protein